jgi:hypothetical protein
VLVNLISNSAKFTINGSIYEYNKLKVKLKLSLINVSNGKQNI